MHKKAVNRKSGQGMTEYIIIVAIVAIGAILIIGLFGKQIKGVFTGMGSALGGTDKQNQAVAKSNIGEMKTEGNEKETMGTFDDQQQ